MELKDRIREAMEGSGLRPLQLARATGKSSGAVSQWMDGTTKSLKAETASMLEKATGYRADWIVTGNGERKVFTNPPYTPSSAIATTTSPSSANELLGKTTIPNNGLPVAQSQPIQFSDYITSTCGRACTVRNIVTGLAVSLSGLDASEHDAVNVLLSLLIKNPSSEKLIDSLTAMLQTYDDVKKKAVA